jgi:hypothetical protein
MILPTAINGKVPTAALSPMPGVNGNGSPHLTDNLAAQSYARLRRDFTAAGLGDLLPSEGWSCYRSLADQAHMRALGLTTVPVGQSIHGEAIGRAAVDFGGVPFGSSRHNWLKAHGSAYGWSQPLWARQSGSNPESWHWEYDTANDTRPGPPPIVPPVTVPPISTEDDTMKPVLALIDPNVSGRWYLIDFTAGTCWWVRNGLQSTVIQGDADVRQLSGPQPLSLLDGLTSLGE